MVNRVTPSLEPRTTGPTPDVDASDPRTSRPVLRHEIREFMASTPGRLTSLGVLLILLTLAAGLLAAATVGNRQTHLGNVLEETEPLANSAQNLYSALSLADAAASTAFIWGGIEPSAVRNRYTQSIGEASAEIVTAAAGLDSADEVGHNTLTTISADLSVYTGLVETARANNRVGNPVGAAYLSEASHLMQTSLLPMAQQLHSAQESQVTGVQNDFARPPWWPVAAFALALSALIATQIRLAQHSRRRFNLGLILASLSVAAALIWVLTVGLISASTTARALDAGAGPLHELTGARIMAQQARTVETLSLARRDSTEADNTVFIEKVNNVDTILRNLQSDERSEVDADVLATALDARDQWVSAHQRMTDSLAVGDFTGAAGITVGDGEQDSAAEYGVLDNALWQAIVDARENLRTDISHASRVLSASAPGVMALAAVAVAGICIGFWPRLREYQ
ncbi:hypothetical protein [Rhodococcus sp. ARC_M6]|uniref:hypothetical protein n=1 Tax=Rhodococcus sp. ARC_M6 TaxID=2928852 RepID=UPI001FB1E93F|nr:hypothetical protein [Rhodococcus sp. ARC_M6]MCJ0902262.1 hypothetical protein [Rhodococcus sp. ARC_M6]